MGIPLIPAVALENMATIVEIEELGRRVRRLRLERRMTLKQVEEACGLSATHLSEIERGRTSPTIGALARIARALRKDTSFFVEAEERADVVHVTRESLKPILAGKGTRIEPMSVGVPGSRIHAYRIVLEGGVFEVSARELPADALYYVRSGEIDIQAGETALRLGPGDAMQASCSLAQRVGGADGRRAEFIIVLTCPLREEPQAMDA